MIKSYRCVTGHSIAGHLFDELTEEVNLDGGALVRVCREHFAPIAVSVEQDEERDEGPGSITER